MSKLLIALMAAGLALGSTLVAAGQSNDQPVRDGATSTQQNAGSPADARRNRDSTQQDSEMIPGPGAGQHPTTSADPSGTDPGTMSSQKETQEEKRRNRDSTQQGDVKPGPGAGTRPSGNPKEPVTTGETPQTPANPGDPKDELRNRDSSKQQPGSENTPPKQ